MYRFRSRFVHEARITRFAPNPEVLKKQTDPTAKSYYSSIFYSVTENGNRVIYSSVLYAEFFYNFVMRHIEGMLKKYLEEVIE